MALHSTPASMLKESLHEILEASKYCIEYKKDDPEKWKELTSNGCLGYPGAILLFSIVDSIGSYYRQNKSFTIEVDGKSKFISSDGWQHFLILNSKYFNQNLSEKFIKVLYAKFRSCLTHNSVLGKDARMEPENSNGMAFYEGLNEKKEFRYIISMKEFWILCEMAIKEFNNDIDAIVPNSKQGKNFH